jgi:hypothetical protein
MGRYPQKPDDHGSLRNIQILINVFPHVVSNELRKMTIVEPAENITWLSPIESDDYAEYRDDAFIKRLGLKDLQIPLSKFWLAGGPQWDGIGKTDRGKVFLVEAKAHIREAVSSPTGARSSDSTQLINASLKAVKEYIGSKSAADWSSLFYQYDNRLAHLYFLRVLNGINAYMIFLYL